MKTLKLLFLLFIAAITACTKQYPQVVFSTELGDITIELYADKAPLTANNFLKYVNENRLEGAWFYRVVNLQNQPNDSIKIEVIQGGLFEDNHPQVLTPIVHETTTETGILHKNGVVSMARMEPGTATCEFFICIGDQPSLDYGGKRNPDGQGFAAFGKVIKGMDVVHKIHQTDAPNQWLKDGVKILDVSLVD